MAGLDDRAFFARPAASVNPIALIVKHLGGNLRSRWADPLGADGESPTRKRDREFVLAADDTREALMTSWTAGWETLASALRRFQPADLDRTVLIRGEPHTLAQALLRGTTHAAYHVGQILYVARMLAPDAPYLTVAPPSLRGASDALRGAYFGRGAEPSG